jgi:membrane-bound lytic murein transglycosylase A
MSRVSTAFAPLVLAGLLLSACASAVSPTPIATGSLTPPPSSTTTPPPSSTLPPTAVSFSSLAGWSEEDHLAALEAFRAGCGVSKDSAMSRVCDRARAAIVQDESSARLFLETNFRPEPVGEQGLLTAYFAPQYEARMSRNAEFTTPVRGLPADLVVLDLGAFEPTFVGKKVTGHVEGPTFVPYPDRAAIEAVPTDKPLAWMRPEELFFLQIQGSGVLVLPDGRRVRAAFAGSNGKPFVGVANAMRDRGLLPDNNTSGDAIMQLNPRYVFFKMAADDGKEAVGAAGVPLPAGRAIAVDPSRHAMGELYWLDAAAPKLSGAFPSYRRLAVALDTGGAIKGDVRADLYMGSGAAAGAEAGRVRHALRLYRLVPRL